MSWLHLGKYYGYPDCCIHWFMHNIGVKKTKAQESSHNYQGFIPCPSCAEKIKGEHSQIHTLINNRICTKPFPETDIETPKEIDKAVETVENIYHYGLDE